MMPKLKIISKKYVILCEGKDAFNFLCYYLNSPSLSCDSRFSNDIQVIDFGGIDELDGFIPVLQNTEGFKNVHHLLIIRDAEKDVARALRMVKHSLGSCNFPIAENCNQWCSSEDGLFNTAYTLFPTCSAEPCEGALEDLCWELLHGDNIIDFKLEIQSFVDHIKNKYQSIVSHDHKSRLHTFFSVNEPFISLKIGEAAKSNAFDWNNEKLIPLMRIIEEGFSDSLT